MLAQKYNDPVATYKEMRERVEQQIDAAFEPPIDERPDLSERQIAWYRRTEADRDD